MKNSTNRQNIEKKFNPISKPISYIDYSLGYRFKTLISYQFGYLNKKSAVKFYINGDFESIRPINKKNTDRHFKMHKCGGQTLKSVRRQREKCLELIVKNFFEKLGFKSKLKPKLGIYQPDMLIKKEELTCYIELKAYHNSYICGDTEISQIMKYYREIVKSIKTDKEQSNTKILLITSGSLIDYSESFLSHPNKDPVEHVTSYYKELIIPKSQMKTLEQYSSRDIYKNAAKKFIKNYRSGFPPMSPFFVNKENFSSFTSYLMSTQEYDLLAINSEVFYKLLKKENLMNEAHKFKLLKEKEMERLVIYGKILKI